MRLASGAVDAKRINTLCANNANGWEIPLAQASSSGVPNTVVSAPSTVLNDLFGKVVAGDGDNANTVDAQGELAYPNVTDLSGFAHRLRYWAKGGALLSPAARGRCADSDLCAIWDLRVNATGVLADRLSGNLAALVDIQRLPTG